MFVVSHSMFAFLPTGSQGLSVVPLCILGLGYCLYSCSLFPCIQLVVKERILGTAFGIKAMCESVALASFPLLGAYLAEEEDSNYGF